MDYKKAIKFLKNSKGRNINFDIVSTIKNSDEIIRLLRQGERYRQMWEEFLDLPLGHFVKPDDKELYFGKIYDLEEKYLLKKDRVLEKIKAKKAKDENNKKSEFNE
ncbi:MAG: hypothetical protein KAW56_10120 [Candidatus Marinimicrobia bacterium]|nr:hypothetical protein [Candidatus Neomarinimicrobiota bacterium]